MAEAYFKGRKYQKALKTYQAIRQKLAHDPGNYYNLVECDYRIYRCLEKMNQKKQAKASARKLLSYYDSIPKKTRSRQRTNISFLRRAARV
jgi:tetratricopeptide (TPR) repeat protein